MEFEYRAALWIVAGMGGVYVASRLAAMAYFHEKLVHFKTVSRLMEQREEYYGKSVDKRQGSGKAGTSSAIDEVHLQATQR